MIIPLVFGAVGNCVGRWPIQFAALSLGLAVLLSAGMRAIRVKDHIRDGYTPENAPSRAETQNMRQFWNATGDPMKTMVLIRGRHRQNMFRLELLRECVKLSQFLQRNFTLSAVNNEDLFTYADLCHPYCDYNFPLELYVDGLNEAVEGRVDPHQNLSFPLASVHSFQIRLEWFFSGVQVHNSSVAQSQLLTREQQLTNIEHVDMVVLTFHADRSSALKSAQLSAWEMGVYEHLERANFSADLDVQVIGVEILDHEMTRDARENVPFFAAGFLATALFVTANVFGTARHCGLSVFGKLLISSATFVCPLLAISSTYGAMTWCGMRINSFLLILPYLVLGIGVDDGFLLMHRWFQLVAQRVPARRMAVVLADVGPSITVTTLTNVVSFGVGAFTPTPEIRLFCFGAAVALTLDFLLQIALFCPVMQFSARFESFGDGKVQEKRAIGETESPSGEEPEKDGKKPEDCLMLSEPKKGTRKWSPPKSTSVGGTEHAAVPKERQFASGVLDAYVALLTNRYFAVLLLCATGVYWYGALVGSLGIQTRLDTHKILPRDSKLRETSRLLDAVVWANHWPVTVLVDGRLNVTAPEQMRHFHEMLAEFESLPHSKGPESSLVWLRDYERFYRGDDDSAERFDAFMGELAFAELDAMRYELRREKGQRVAGSEGALDLCRLDQFLDLPYYAHWAPLVHHEQQNDSCPVVTASIVVFAYHDTGTWDTRIRLMQQWRQLARRHSRRLGLQVTVWEENAMFVDQMLSLRSVATQSWLLTLCCMLAVCALFVPNVFSVLLSGASISSISVGVFGFLSWLRFDLDPITMAATLMSIGLSVDFTAHVVYHFRQDFRLDLRTCPESGAQIVYRLPLTGKADKLRHTLEAVGWPMLQSGISTALCISPLMLVRKYAPRVFVHTVFLVAGWGLVHGLLILPCVLCLLPAWCSSSALPNALLRPFNNLFARTTLFQVKGAERKKPLDAQMEMAMAQNAEENGEEVKKVKEEREI